MPAEDRFPGPCLSDFSMRRPPVEVEQERALAWLLEAHVAAETTRAGLDPPAQAAFRHRLERLAARCACGPDRIRSRGHHVTDVGLTEPGRGGLYDVARHPSGGGTAERTARFAEAVAAYFEDEYATVARPPRDLVHVTCTGYAAPSGAQLLVARRGWGGLTRVTHAYHMGCYAALPAVRLAAGLLAVSGPGDADERVDLVHTELCSLHVDPADHSAEQLVVQSLFGDGLIRYAARPDRGQPGLRLVRLVEEIVPGTAAAMRWWPGDHGMRMGLSRDVPRLLAGCLGPFVARLLGETRPEAAIFAVHPGGPRIVDEVQRLLGLGDAQVAESRAVLRDYGNLSSATLPHIWMRLLADPAIRPGTPVASLAFGPGLTLAGGLFTKV